MNASVSSQEIADCPGVFVDAFRGKTMWSITRDSQNTLILSHYHNDHYGNLPREGKFAGPAKIHCTIITARLLVYVHKVPREFVVPHEYNDPWMAETKNGRRVQITFCDANHCPGAAITLIKKEDGYTHVHCGDMRYHKEMKRYPSLRRAVERNTIDLVYLDSTYGHPKHDFPPQHSAVDEIAETADEIVREYHDKNVLFLLSCYSIGKEKVLWKIGRYIQQRVLVTETKLRMLQCMFSGDDLKVLARRITRDPAESDVHVVPMGLAGELWPYFRPNHKACAEYAERSRTRYSRVVAFLPTGWAHGSNWNHKNAVTRKEMPYRNRKIPVEIRLVPYSEHSSFGELLDFVEFLRPRQVIPTVFSDEADRRKIEKHFRNLVDNKRAKQQFFSGMTSGATMPEESLVESMAAAKMPTENHRIDVDNSSLRRRSSPMEVDGGRDDKELNGKMEMLTSMGFPCNAALRALKRNGKNVERALDELLYKPSNTIAKRKDSNYSSSRENQAARQASGSKEAKKPKVTETIAHFFQRNQPS